MAATEESLEARSPSPLRRCTGTIGRRSQSEIKVGNGALAGFHPTSAPDGKTRQH